MKRYYLFILPLLLSLFACCQQNKIKDDLEKINRENPISKSIKVKKELFYKFSNNLVYNYLITNNENRRILINNDNDSFVIAENSGVLYFYNSCNDSLYYTTNKRDFVWLLWNDLFDKHLFVLNPKKYWSTNRAKKFSIADEAKNNLLQINFVMKIFNIDLLIDKTFIKNEGTYLVDDSSFLIRYFYREFDPELIAGDGAYKEKYKLIYNFDSNKFSNTISFADSIIAGKTKIDFPNNYDLETNLFNNCKKTGKHQTSEELVHINCLNSLNGDSLFLSDVKSDYILIDFWFMRCPGCIQGIPHINKINTQYSSEKLMILGVNPIDKNFDAIKDFSQKKNILYPIYMSDKKFAEQYDVKSYPTYILVDNRKDAISIIGRFNVINELHDALKELK